jgi:hypothetical protein
MAVARVENIFKFFYVVKEKTKQKNVIHGLMYVITDLLP